MVISASASKNVTLLTSSVSPSCMTKDQGKLYFSIHDPFKIGRLAPLVLVS